MNDDVDDIDVDDNVDEIDVDDHVDDMDNTNTKKYLRYISHFLSPVYLQVLTNAFFRVGSLICMLVHVYVCLVSSVCLVCACVSMCVCECECK